MRRFGSLLVFACLLAFVAPVHASVSTPITTLPYGQTWSDSGMITANDDWAGVTGVEGYLGDVDPASPTGVDPQTVTVNSTTTDVIANQTNPNTLTSGGVAEFEIADPVVALQGSGTADAANLVFRLDLTGRSGVSFAYVARDIDGSADNAVQQMALQYRVGTTGPYTNLPAGYVADATEGPSLATKRTPVNVALPAATDNQADIFVRVITTNALGSDEWVGVDDVQIVQGTVNQVPVTACGTTLTVDQGSSASRDVTALDPDGSVTAITLGTLPAALAAKVTLGATTAEIEPTTPATARVTVDATGVPAGDYSIPVSAENDGGLAGSCAIRLTVSGTTLISAVQGATGPDPLVDSAYASPFKGQTVTVEGIVTGLDDKNGASNSNPTPGFPDDRGIFVQEEPGQSDANDATSEGIFVGNVEDVQGFPIGTRVRVTGQVVEKFDQTQINTSTANDNDIVITTVAALVLPAHIPTPVTIVQAAAEAQATHIFSGSGQCSFPFDVCRNGRRALYERLEGMLVTIPTATANSGGTNKFAELFLNPGTTQDVVLVKDDTTGPGGGPEPLTRSLIAAVGDAGAGNPANPQKDRGSTTNVFADQFDQVQNLRGPLSFSFSNYKVVPQVGAAAPTVVKGPTPYPYTGVPVKPAGTLRVGFFNVENLFPTTGFLDGANVTQAEFDEKVAREADAIDRLLKRPDVLGIEEIGDALHGPGSNGTTTSLQTLQALATKLGGYTAYVEEGNDNRGIDVGFLIKDGVTVTSVTQIGKTATEMIAASCSDVANGLFDRPPLVAKVSKDGFAFAVIANHWSSKAAPDSCRDAQADFVNAYVEADPSTDYLVGGDLNAFEYETPLDRLQGNGTTLNNLIDQDALVPAAQRYTFHFSGRLQVLDHAVVTNGLASKVRDVRFAHFNNDYYDRNLENDGAGCGTPTPPAACTDGHKSSDHDPPLITLNIPAVVPPPPPPPPPPPGPPPPPPPPSPPTAKQLLAALKLPGTIKARASDNTVRFTIKNTSASAFKLGLVVSKRGKRYAAGSRQLLANRSRAVVLSGTSKLRALARGTRNVTLAITIGSGGKSVTRKVAVKLKKR